MVSRRLFEILGLACGFGLIDYGFNFVASGLPGARELTSQFVGANLILGGSAAIFISLYYLLRSAPVATATPPKPVGTAPDVGVETIIEEEGPPKSSFYRKIEYVGYIFTIVGLFSVADLILQVFLRSIYNETRWWIEILLVIFGVLSYTIFVSIGRLGSQEEAKLTGPIVQPKLIPEHAASEPPTVAAAYAPSYAEVLDVRVGEFTKAASGEYERHLSGEVFDNFRVESDLVTIWREDRKGMRSVYLAGPYELKRNLLEEHLNSGQELKIGYLTLSIDTIRELLAIQERREDRIPSPAN